MKANQFLFTSLACLVCILLNGCQEDDTLHKRGSSQYFHYDKLGEMLDKPGTTACKLITFDKCRLSAGDIVSEIYSTDGTGPVKIMGFNPRFGENINAAMIFDTSNPTGDDPDLGTPNQDFGGPGKGVGGRKGSPYENNVTLENVLIVSEDLNADNPDDEGSKKGAQLIFDFSEFYAKYNNVSVSLDYMDILDVEENETGENAFIKLYDKDGNLLEEVLLPSVGNNGYARFNFEQVPFVYKAVVEFLGSGAVDNIAFCVEKTKCKATKYHKHNSSCTNYSNKHKYSGKDKWNKWKHYFSHR